MNASWMSQNAATGLRAAAMLGIALIMGGQAADLSAQDIVAAGYQHSCAVIAGRLRCWGNNGTGELGNGAMLRSSTPVYVSRMDGEITSAATGQSFTCAAVDGGLKCWGVNSLGQLGHDVQNPEGNFSPLPVHTFPPGSGVTAVATGTDYACAIVNQGLQCWGDNAVGQLGTGDYESAPTPVAIFPPQSGVTAVAAGYEHTCAVTFGIVRCWGNNAYGQLGIGNYDSSPSPVVVGGLSAAVGITAGEHHTCVLLESGGVKCWGRNSSGQLGTTAFTSNSNIPMTAYRQSSSGLPVPVELTDGTAIAAGGNHTCAMVSDSAYCWGENDFGQLGIGFTVAQAYGRPVVGFDHGVTAIAAGSKHTCGIADGWVHCWGSNESLQLGDSVSSVVWTPTPSPALDGQVDIDGGTSHSCARRNGGAYCWGKNADGELGDNGSADSATPVVVSGLPPASSVSATAAGDLHSCAVANGLVRCWGDNASGQLGDGTHDASPVPVLVSGINTAVAVGAGNEHTCARLDNGNVQCWGRNDKGQLGDGNFDESTIPATVLMPLGQFHPPLANVEMISAGNDHNCAVIANDGGVRCWGRNDFGQLGNGSTTDSSLAVPVAGLGGGSHVVMVSSGGARIGAHTCAVVDDGIQCWGQNFRGQLGNATTTGEPSLTPVIVVESAANPVPLSGATAVATGAEHSCAVVNGGVRCWGSEDSGQLGISHHATQLGYSTTPVVAIPDNSGITTIMAGSDYTCAGNAAHQYLCWGSVMHGRLGNGDLGYATVPTPVVVDLDKVFADDFEYPITE